MPPSSVTDLVLRSSASLLDGGSTKDEQAVIEQVAEWVENVCLTFLKGQAMAFLLLLMVFLIDMDDFVDPVSADLAMVRKCNNVPLLTQSYLYRLRANFQYLSFCQHCHGSQYCCILLVQRWVCELT